MKKKPTSDWARLQAMTDEDIDYSDIPPLDASVLASMKVRMPVGKIPVTLRVDADVLDWYKGQGAGYQTRMHAVLKGYMQGVGEPAAVRESPVSTYKVEDKPARRLADSESTLAKPSQMTLRKDIGYYVRTRVPVGNGLLDIALGYSEKEGSAAYALGRFRLNLPRLLALGHIRPVTGSRKDLVILLRLNSDGIIGLQTRKDQPFLPLARVPTG